MWRFKQFMPKEQTGLEGRIVDIGSIKVQVRNVLAEGGFSCVYLATDAVQTTKNYALKHMICNDEESLDLAKKEVSVMKILKGHPNIITLHASAIFEMGRTKEVLLLMEFCEKSLVNVLENRGAGYFEEKQVLMIFRDICNAVFSTHCRTPPIAHRDLKAENVLLGADGAWKLCDFGSTSTNHKCFSRPEEMGVEEDVIRKHTTPAYRAPEMWDLYRKEIISEKVDIWALGCLLYRICYLKSAFDGESKLQILNGNYRIPDLPKYSATITDLIKDMLQSSPQSRPDITQVWFRVNLQLPVDLQKQMPDNVATLENNSRTANGQKDGMPKKESPVPRRSPPPPPSQKENPNIFQVPLKAGEDRAPMGAFWSSQHAVELQFDDNSKHRSMDSPPLSSQLKSSRKTNESSGEDFEIRFDKDGEYGKISGSQLRTKTEFSAFDGFVADLDHEKVKVRDSASSTAVPREDLVAEVERLKDQVKQANLEKAEITARCEKLSAICRSQRQEIQELKQSLASKTNSAKPIPEARKEQMSPGSFLSPSPQREKIEGSIKELSDSILKSSPSPSSSSSSNQWQPFAEQPKPPQSTSRPSHPRSVRTISGRHSSSRNPNSPPIFDSWDFGQENFVAAQTSSPQESNSISFSHSAAQNLAAAGLRPSKPLESHPSGWAGF
ncbi:protein kinase superfamily protein isoform X2 [Wolffia australiana]